MSRSIASLWLGASDTLTEGSFVWDSSGSSLAQTFTKWSTGSPSNLTGKEDCVVQTSSNDWKAVDCLAADQSTICEMVVDRGPPGLKLSSTKCSIIKN